MVLFYGTFYGPVQNRTKSLLETSFPVCSTYRPQNECEVSFLTDLNYLAYAVHDDNHTNDMNNNSNQNNNITELHM